MKNRIAFRKNFIFLPESDKPASDEIVMSVITDLMNFGFMPTEKAQAMMKSAGEETLITFHNEVIDYLNTVMGGKGEFRSFWKNFPESVMDKSESELLTHMLINYWTCGAYEPNEFTGSRPEAYEKGLYTYYDAADEKQFLNIFTTLVSVNQSLTPQDLDDVKWFAANVKNPPMPDRIPFKETLCVLADLGMDIPVKTTTDVLRVAVHMSGGDTALPKVPAKYNRRRINTEREKFKFKKFTRSERVFIMSLLNKTNCDAREGVLKRERWLRLGEVLHPGEYARRFPNASIFFEKLRNEKIRSWNSDVVRSFKRGFDKGLDKLAERPGEYVRRLDAMLRNNPAHADEILGRFKKIGDKISNKVLFENYTYFSDRDKMTYRKIRIKTSRRRTELPPLQPLPEKIVSSIKNTLNSVLAEKFRKLPTLGKVWIDEELKKIPLPSSMRNASASLKPRVRGQRVKWKNPEAKVIRAFLHFHKASTNMTIDLSAICIGELDSFVIDWSRQKPKGNIIIHSGDSWMRRGDCAEYVDIDVKAMLEKGYRYVLIQLNNYTNAPELEHNNYFGIMERTKPKSRKKWLPKTIENCMTVSVKNKSNCAVIDLETREYIPIDEDAGADGAIQNASIKDMNSIKELVEPPKFSVYDLLTLHAENRGSVVDKRKDADTIYEFSSFADSYTETLKFMGI